MNRTHFIGFIDSMLGYSYQKFDSIVENHLVRDDHRDSSWKEPGLLYITEGNQIQNGMHNHIRWWKRNNQESLSSDRFKWEALWVHWRKRHSEKDRGLARYSSQALKEIFSQGSRSSGAESRLGRSLHQSCEIRSFIIWAEETGGLCRVQVWLERAIWSQRVPGRILGRGFKIRSSGWRQSKDLASPSAEQVRTGHDRDNWHSPGRNPCRLS